MPDASSARLICTMVTWEEEEMKEPATMQLFTVSGDLPYTEEGLLTVSGSCVTMYISCGPFSIDLERIVYEGQMSI